MRSHAERRNERGFTLIELLIVMVILAMLAGLALVALQRTREAAREAKTKAIIAKINDVIWRKYESYKTRRVPINTQGMTRRQAMDARQKAIQDIMRMEMPDLTSDVSAGGTVPQTAVAKVYQSLLSGGGGRGAPNANYMPAKLLYMIVMTGNAEAREAFRFDETMVDTDGWPMFADGWNRPIMWLRWAPGFVKPNSDIQDPIDPNNPDVFALKPLIYSGGPDREFAIELAPSAEPFTSNWYNAGKPQNTRAQDNIHNHHIEAR